VAQILDIHPVIFRLNQCDLLWFGCRWHFPITLYMRFRYGGCGVAGASWHPSTVLTWLDGLVSQLAWHSRPYHPARDGALTDEEWWSDAFRCCWSTGHVQCCVRRQLHHDRVQFLFFDKNWIKMTVQNDESALTRRSKKQGVLGCTNTTMTNKK